MKISKYFRQNSRTLILVFMSLLLVAFLIPNTIQGIGGREGDMSRKIGSAFGHKLTAKDWAKALSETQVLEELMPRQGPMTSEDRIRYYLLMQEAERMGVRISRELAQDSLAAGLEAQARRVARENPNIPPEQIQAELANMQEQKIYGIQTRHGLSANQIYDAVGRWIAVEKLAGLQAAGLIESLPRKESEYRNQRQQAVAKLAVLDDKAFLARVPEPTEEQVQAFYEAAKDRAPSHTEEQLAFGYQLPDRVQIEYLTVDPNEVRDKISVQQAQAKRWYEDHKNLYVKPNPLATQPADPQVPAQVPMTFEEARDRARNDYRTSRAIEEARRLIDDVDKEARRPWLSTGHDPNGFSNPPEGESVSFEKLAQTYSTNFPVQYRKLDLLSEEDLAKVPGVGAAELRGGRTNQERTRVAQLAFRVAGLLPADPNDAKPVLALMEPSDVVANFASNRITREFGPQQSYVFRVVQVAPKAPAPLETVRAQVISDWKLTEAHKLAQQEADKLAARAREIGLTQAVAEATSLKDLLAAADQAASLPAGPTDPNAAPPAPPTQYAKDLEPFQPENLTRSARFIQSLGSTDGVPAAIFKLADAPADPNSSKKVTTVPLVLAAGSKVTNAAAERARWVVAELQEVKPLYEEDFQKYLVGSLAQGLYSELQEFPANWESATNVFSRTNYVSEIGGRPEPR